MGVVADGVCGVFFVAALSVCGGVFNHMRGSNGGMLSADAFAGLLEGCSSSRRLCDRRPRAKIRKRTRREKGRGRG